jgi:serine/threonine protein kinase
VVHLDIRPENLVLDEKGFVKIINFSSAKIKDKENIKEEIISENPLYLAPEILCGMSYTFCADYYSLGIIFYEFIMGHKPFSGNTLREVKEKIMTKQYQIKPEEIPRGWSNDAADLVNKLIMRKPFERIGFNGIDEIKNHPWFSNIIWKDYYYKKMKTPFINLNVDDAYNKLLYSPDKRDSMKRDTSVIKRLKPNFTDFAYYDKKSPSNLYKKQKLFYNPHTKSNYTHQPETISRKETISKDNYMSSKSSSTKSHFTYDNKSLKSSASLGLISNFSERSINKNVIPGTNIFGKKICGE